MKNLIRLINYKNEILKVINFIIKDDIIKFYKKIKNFQIKIR